MTNVKLSSLFISLLATSPTVQSYSLPISVRHDLTASTASYPLQTLAGVPVIDTPIVRDAQAFAREHTYPSLYNHVVRSWLLGALIINANETLRDQVDLEVHAVGALLHDIGLDPAHFNSSIISPDRRFEVDGAIAAREFVQQHPDGRAWGKERLQLLWDSVALHSTFNIADYKELEVQSVSKGVRLDLYQSADYGVTLDKIKNVSKAFPLEDIRSGLNDSFIWLCQNKADTTYLNWQQSWGEAYVANYSAKGNGTDSLMLFPPPSQILRM